MSFTRGKGDLAKLKDFMKNPRKYGIRGCLLCGRSDDFYPCFFWPNETAPALFGKGLCLYGLCEACSLIPAAIRHPRVEGIFLRDLSAQN
jgi:hypothetical protein